MVAFLPATRRRKRATVAAVSTIVALLAVELVLRVRAAPEQKAFDLASVLDQNPPLAEGEAGGFRYLLRARDEPDLVYDYRPAFRGTINMDGVPTEVRTNSLGLRGPELSRAKPAGTVRIAGLGDSFMLGFGIPEERTFLELLRESIEEACPGLACETINTACAGYNTAQEVAAFRLKALELEPDLVLLGMTFNDTEGAIYQTTRDETWALDRSFLLDVLLRRPSDATGASDSRAKRGGWEMFEAALDELARLRKESGFEVLAFTYRRNQRSQRMLELCRARGFLIEDLSVPLGAYMRARGIKDYAASPLALHAGNAHPSALHNGLIAEHLFDALKRLGALERLCTAR